MNRKKTLTFSLIGVAAVALVTVGFSTWIVGINNSTVDNNITLTVDSASNNSVYLEAALESNSVFIGESATVSRPTNGIIGVEDIQTGNNPLQFTFSSVVINVGVGVSEDDMPKNLKIELTGCPAATSQLGDLAPTNRGTSYLSFSKIIPVGVTDFNVTTPENGDYKTYTLKTNSYTLEWGNFYSNQLPSTFYNNLAASQTSYANKLTLSENAKKELDEMESKLEASEAIKITVSIE